jgi:hypothetical protein
MPIIVFESRRRSQFNTLAENRIGTYRVPVSPTADAEPEFF